MKLLIAVRKQHYFRYAASVIHALGEEDQAIVFLPDLPLEDEIPFRAQVSYRALRLPASRPVRLLRILRDLRGYLHWVSQGERDWELLERTLRRHVPASLRSFFFWLHRARLTGILAFPPLLHGIRRLEDLVAVEKAVLEEVKEIEPELILVTPAIFDRCYELEYLKAGLRLGIPTAILIGSWDNLTTKGTFSLIPQRVLVWNENMALEAQKYHGLPADKLVVVGAALLDQVFDPGCVEERASFCRRAGLDPGRPFVLYTASAKLPHTDEPALVSRLAAEMRRLPALSGVQLMVRPHPNHIQEWAGWQPPDAGVILWSEPSFPTSAEKARDLYSSIAHSCAVIGLSTSVFLETAILDRPCGLIHLPAGAQGSRISRFLHYQYWLESGFIEASRDEAGCARWLVEVCDGRDSRREERRRFVHSYLRPCGVERRAGDVTVEVLRQMAKGGS